MLYTEYDTRLAAYAWITDGSGRVLLSWFRGTAVAEPCWSLPGGGVEFGEKADDACVREVLEETGYQVDHLRLVGFDSQYVPAIESERPRCWLRVLYAATIVGGELGTTEVDGSTLHADWVPISDLARVPTAGVVGVAADLMASTTPE